MMMSVLQRAKDSGKCPPSLISIEDVDSDGFGSDASQLLDTTGKDIEEICVASKDLLWVTPLLIRISNNFSFLFKICFAGLGLSAHPAVVDLFSAALKVSCLFCAR